MSISVFERLASRWWEVLRWRFAMQSFFSFMLSYLCFSWKIILSTFNSVHDARIMVGKPEKCSVRWWITMILKGMPAGVSKHVPRSIVAYMQTTTIVNCTSLFPETSTYYLYPASTHYLSHVASRWEMWNSPSTDSNMWMLMNVTNHLQLKAKGFYAVS